MAEKAETICRAESEVGRCAGAAQCDSVGSLICTVLTPTAELCDGADNDRNGAVDDEVPSASCLVEDSGCDGGTDCVDGRAVCDTPPAPEAIYDGVDMARASRLELSFRSPRARRC